LIERKSIGKNFWKRRLEKMRTLEAALAERMKEPEFGAEYEALEYYHRNF